MSDVSRRVFMHAAGVAAMAVNAVPSASAAANSSRVAGKVKTISSRMVWKRRSWRIK
jgi:hypothetical protein